MVTHPVIHRPVGDHSSSQQDQGPSSPRASDDDAVPPGSRRSRSLSRAGYLPGHTGTAMVTQP